MLPPNQTPTKHTTAILDQQQDNQALPNQEEKKCIKTAVLRPRTRSRSSRGANKARGPPNRMNRKSLSRGRAKYRNKKPATETGSSRYTHNHKLNQNTPEKKNSGTKMIDQDQSSKSLCGICFDFMTDSHIFRSTFCNHPFCIDCISKHVAAQINKNVVTVNCPNPDCRVELKPEHLQSILPSEVIVGWETVRCESSIDSLQKSYCPFKNCSVLLVNDGAEVVTSSECPSCHRLFCAQCKVPWHSGMNCQEFQKLKSCENDRKLDTKFLELAKKEMWQKCPKCSIYVQKMSGCEHMTCRCGCNFCYICGGMDWRPGHLCRAP